MKLRVVVIGLACVAGALSIFTAVADTGDNWTGGALPGSLDQFYPPQSQAPVYLLAMLDLARPLSGTMCDVLENDLENARKNFEAFKKAYINSAAMIPEWKDKYPMEPVENLGTALMTGDLGQIMPASEAVGAVCDRCHFTFMPVVQQKYRWDDFGDINLTDPLSQREVGFAQLMLMMETNFEGIGNDLHQGQVTQAREQFNGFRSRFETISDACSICHETERLYYVSDDITGKISKLGEELDKPNINPDAIAGYLMAIGQESCSRCHLVHIPAAYSQKRMKLH